MQDLTGPRRRDYGGLKPAQGEINAFAAAVGVSPRTIQNWLRRGLLYVGQGGRIIPRPRSEGGTV